MKITNIFFVLVFLLSAILQLNDPDPFLWFSIYLFGAILCVLPLFKKGISQFFWIATVFYLGAAVFLLLIPDGAISWYRDHDAENIVQAMKADKPWIENTREFFGLIILSIAMLLNLRFPSKTNGSNFKKSSY